MIGHPSLRIQASPDDRQFAIVNLVMLKAEQDRLRIYVGVCGCEQSLQSGVLIITQGTDIARCVFCGEDVALRPLPLFSELLEVLQYGGPTRVENPDMEEVSGLQTEAGPDGDLPVVPETDPD